MSSDGRFLALGDQPHHENGKPWVSPAQSYGKSAHFSSMICPISKMAEISHCKLLPVNDLVTGYCMWAYWKAKPLEVENHMFHPHETMPRERKNQEAPNSWFRFRASFWAAKCQETHGESLGKINGIIPFLYVSIPFYWGNQDFISRSSNTKFDTCLNYLKLDHIFRYTLRCYMFKTNPTGKTTSNDEDTPPSTVCMMLIASTRSSENWDPIKSSRETKRVLPKIMSSLLNPCPSRRWLGRLIPSPETSRNTSIINAYQHSSWMWQEFDVVSFWWLLFLLYACLKSCQYSGYLRNWDTKIGTCFVSNHHRFQRKWLPYG